MLGFQGVLAEILEPIMGKGLIPADPETWVCSMFNIYYVQTMKLCEFLFFHVLLSYLLSATPFD